MRSEPQAEALDDSEGHDWESRNSGLGLATVHLAYGAACKNLIYVQPPKGQAAGGQITVAQIRQGKGAQGRSWNCGVE